MFRGTQVVQCDPGMVLDVLEQRNEHIVSFVGQGEVLLTSLGKEHRAKIFVAFLKPGHVMLKLFAPNGSPVMIFLVRDGVLASYDFHERVISRRAVRDGVIRLDGDLEIPIDQFIAACTGNVEPIHFDHISCYRKVRDNQTTDLVLRKGVLTKVVQYVHLNSEGFRAEKVQIRRNGRIELSVSFQYSDKGKKTFVPETVLIDFPNRMASIRFEYRQTEINAKLSPEHFRFQVPEHWRIEDSS